MEEKQKKGKKLERSILISKEKRKWKVRDNKNQVGRIRQERKEARVLMINVNDRFLAGQGEKRRRRRGG